MSRNIKEIGKELLGKSLNSFHRKTGLTQLEKNNEMQDGILNGILSQVDDAYIEKTEQSNVIHLDGSGDGVVVADSIEGNTMVNLIITNMMNFENNSVNAKNITTVDLKPSTTYTFVAHLKDVSSTNTWLARFHFNNITDGKEFYINVAPHQTYTSNSIVKYSFTTPDSNYIYRRTWVLWNAQLPEGEKMSFHNAMLIEGDWTNKEVNLFNGLQSSFEEKVNDEGKYEIEILSNNRNMIDLYDENTLQQKHSDFKINSNSSCTLQSDVDGWRARYRIPVKKGRSYTLSANISDGVNYPIRINDKEEMDNAKIWELNLGHLNGKGYKTKTFIATKDFVNILFYKGSSQPTCDITNIMLTPNDTNISFENMKQNKIKLLIDEPLRAIDNTKDRLCIKNGKLLVERKCAEEVFDGSRSVGIVSEFTTTNRYSLRSTYKYKTSSTALSDKFPSNNTNDDFEHIRYDGSTPYSISLQLYINKNKLASSSVTEVKKYLQNNPMRVVGVLAEPIYEEVLNEYGEPILLEGYENGTIYIDSTIVPTTTVRYTPKMESFKTLKEVNKNNNLTTLDINENIIPYMMDVDYMIMEKELCLLNTKNIRKMEELDMTSMQKRTQDMLERLIKGKTLTEQECKTRVTTYLNAGKITDEQAEELMLLIDEVYA